MAPPRRDADAGGENASDAELLRRKDPKQFMSPAKQAKDDEIGGRCPRDGEAGAPGRSVQPREGTEDESGEGDEEEGRQKSPVTSCPELAGRQVGLLPSAQGVEEPIAEVDRPNGEKERGETGGVLVALPQQAGGEQQRPAQSDEGSVETEEGGQQGDGAKRGDGRFPSPCPWVWTAGSPVSEGSDFGRAGRNGVGGGAAASPDRAGLRCRLPRRLGDLLLLALKRPEIGGSRG